MHQRILLFQGVIFSSISTIYLFFDVQIAFWLMNVVPTMLYIIMYFQMFATGVRLRYTHPDVPRRYRVPFGNIGMWLLALVGSAAGLVAIAFAFLPPGNVPEDMRPSYITVVTVAGMTPDEMNVTTRPIRFGWTKAGLD